MNLQPQDKRVLVTGSIGGIGRKIAERHLAERAIVYINGRNELDLSYTPPLSSPWDPVQMAAQVWVPAWKNKEELA